MQNKKTFISWMLVLTFVISMLSVTSISVNAENHISVYLNNQELSFDVPPAVENERVLVPMRVIFEAMGMDVSWESDSNLVIASGSDNAIVLPINTSHAFVNGELLPLEVPARAIDNRILVPLRFVAESLKADVKWDGDSNTVNISYNTGSNQDKNDYENIYSDYIANNVEYFDRGMMLCDLNNDNIPELFSINYDATITYHSFNGDSLSPSDTVKTVYSENIILNETYYMNSWNFIGLYKNKSTGRIALISSCIGEYGDDFFDVITYEDGAVVIKNEAQYQYMYDDIGANRDRVMSNYELVDNKLYMEFAVRGSFGGEYGFDAVETLKSLINKFKAGYYEPIEYNNTTDGSFKCYIRNINTTNNEFELIPAAEITYEEFTNAMNGDKLVTINGESMSIQIDDYLYEDFGIAELFQMPWFSYQFEVPTKEYSPSVIDAYMGRTPVKVKISKDFKIYYEFYDNFVGMKPEYTLEEYLPHFAEYDMGSPYVATVENGEITSLTVLYRP